VSQEPQLFDLSLEENVLYGCFDATHDEVEHAAKLALMDYVWDNRMDWSDKVGFGGKLLSGGQKQRCAIARALIRKPLIFILDEATSALDVNSEREIQKVFDTRENCTTVTIAHRLKTIANSDYIVVLGSGSVVELGDKNTLLQDRTSMFWKIAHKYVQPVANEDTFEACL